ncbi:MAG: glycosyltransferase family 4 protein [Deltaproteobacteria bacterium]|nr:glycosyltransferase family 4 protein [Deltaproteobacteria bacterium]
MKKDNKPPRVCIISRRFHILSRSSDHGFIWAIAKGLAQLGHQVTVISYSSPMNQFKVERDQLTAYFLNDEGSKFKRTSFEKSVYQHFVEIHKQQAFDLVHSLDASGNLVAKNKKNLKIAFAYDVEATQMSQIFAILGMRQETLSGLLTTAFALVYKFLTTYFGSDRELLKYADGVFVTHPMQRIMLERYYLYPDYHIYSVPYGIEVGDLTPKEKSLELKRILNLPENSHIAVTISDMSDFMEIKNILYAFETVAIKKPNAYLVIIGNGPSFQKIEFLILSLALGSRVILTGALKDHELLDYIIISDTYVNLSSRSTGFEPTQIEAMAQKKVIIGSEVSPISNVVEDGIDGFLIRPADTDSLANLLIEIFSGSLPTEEIGEKARQKVLEMFDTQKMILTVNSSYQKIIQNKRS